MQIHFCLAMCITFAHERAVGSGSKGPTFLGGSGGEWGWRIGPSAVFFFFFFFSVAIIFFSLPKQHNRFFSHGQKANLFLSA